MVNIIEDNEEVRDELPTTKQIVHNHAEKDVIGAPYICHICKKVSTKKVSLQMHMLNNHSESVYTCGICGKSGMNKLAHRNHKRSKH